MKIIYRYILREFAYPSVIGILVFTFMSLVSRLKQIVSLIIEKKVPVLIVLEIVLYMLPFMIIPILPMALLFGILFAFGRLSTESEIIAMRSTGISLNSILKPVLVFGIVFMVINFWFMNYLLPITNHRYKVWFLYIASSNPGVSIEERRFTSIDGGKMKISTLKLVDNEMHSLFIEKNNPKENTIDVITAKKGIWENNSLNSAITFLNLMDGEILRIDKKNKQNISHSEFKKMQIQLINNTSGPNASRLKHGYREISVFDMHKIFLEKKKNKKKITPYFWIEYHKKISFPIACLIFAVISFPLAISMPRGGRNWGLLFSIIVVFLYYLLLTLGEILGSKKIIHPIAGVYLPIIVSLVGSAFLYIYRISRS